MRQPLRAYIASKVGLMEGPVKDLKMTLQEMGIEINYDWTENIISKPFEDHVDQVQVVAEKMAKAVMECDVLIVLFVKGGLGLHIETGGALVSSIILSFITGQKRKHIFVVGEGNDTSAFYFHDSVKRVPDIPSLIRELEILQS